MQNSKGKKKKKGSPKEYLTIYLTILSLSLPEGFLLQRKSEGIWEIPQQLKEPSSSFHLAGPQGTVIISALKKNPRAP